MEIHIHKLAGAFAENKDIARDIRLTDILPAMERKEEVIIDFSNVTGTTQSFIHALISDVIRKHGSKALDEISFKSCNKTVQKIISIVSEYMQDSMDENEEADS